MCCTLIRFMNCVWAWFTPKAWFISVVWFFRIMLGQGSGYSLQDHLKVGVWGTVQLDPGTVRLGVTVNYAWAPNFHRSLSTYRALKQGSLWTSWQRWWHKHAQHKLGAGQWGSGTGTIKFRNSTRQPCLVWVHPDSTLDWIHLNLIIFRESTYFWEIKCR